VNPTAHIIPKIISFHFEQRLNQLKGKFESIPNFNYPKIELLKSLNNFNRYCRSAYNDTRLSSKVISLMSFLNSYIREGKNITGQDLFESIKSGFNISGKAVRFTRHEQIGLLEFLYSERIAYLITQENKLEHVTQETILDPNGDKWQKASLNLAGLHCRGHNYDAMQTAYPNKSQVLALVCDGVSGEGRPHGEKHLLLGRALAQFATTKFPELIDKHNLRTIPADEARIGRKAFVNKILQQLQKEMANAFRENRLTQELTIDFTQTFSCVPATTFTAVLDFGDEVGLISIGDSHIFALDDRGLIDSSINHPHTSKTSGEDKLHMHSALGLFYQSRGSNSHTLAANSQSYHRKKDVGVIIASSDGLLDKKLNRKSTIDTRQINLMRLHELETSTAILLKLLSTSSSEDDKTVQVLLRQPGRFETFIKEAQNRIRQKLNI